jgi:hypothetical protein
MKFVYFTDLHLSSRNPPNRIGDYRADILDKLLQIVYLANKTDALAFGGDFFDAPGVSQRWLMRRIDIKTILQAAEAISYLHVPFVTAIGQHDSSTAEALEESALCILWKITNRIFSSEQNIMGIKFKPCNFWDDLDSCLLNCDQTTVVLAHKLITESRLPYNCHPIDELATNAGLVLSGDLHSKFLVHHGKTIWANPGPVARRKPSDSWIPQCFLCEFSSDRWHVQFCDLEHRDHGAVFSQQSPESAQASASDQFADSFRAVLQKFASEAVDARQLIMQSAEAASLDKGTMAILREVCHG